MKTWRIVAGAATVLLWIELSAPTGQASQRPSPVQQTAIELGDIPIDHQSVTRVDSRLGGPAWGQPTELWLAGFNADVPLV